MTEEGRKGTADGPATGAGELLPLAFGRPDNKVVRATRGYLKKQGQLFSKNFLTTIGACPILKQVRGHS